MLPLITAGAVKSSSDTQGRLYYWSTGRQVPDQVHRFDFDPIDAAVEWYGQAFTQERINLESLESSGSEVFIPLPSGIGG